MNHRTGRGREHGAMLLPALWLLVSMCGCAEEGQEKTPLVFDASVAPTTTTRLSALEGETTTENISSMGMFAYYTGQKEIEAADYQTLPNYMYDEKVERAGSGAPWVCDVSKYWPNTEGDKISFFAYSPHQSKFTTGGGGVTWEGGNEGKIAYRVPDRDKDQVDLVVGKIQNATKDTPLRFRMEHTLVALHMNIRTKYDLEVSKFELTNVVKERSFDLSGLDWCKPETDPYQQRGTVHANLNDGSPMIVQGYKDHSLGADRDILVALFYLIPIEPRQDWGTVSIVLHYKMVGDDVLIKKTIPMPVDGSWGSLDFWPRCVMSFYLNLEREKISVKISNADEQGKWGTSDVEVDCGTF